MAQGSCPSPGRRKHYTQRKGSPWTRPWPIAFRHTLCLVIILHGFCASVNPSLKNAWFLFVLWIFNSVKYDQVTHVLPFSCWPVFQEWQLSPVATGRKNSLLFCAYACFQTCVRTPRLDLAVWVFLCLWLV